MSGFVNAGWVHEYTFMVDMTLENPVLDVSLVWSDPPPLPGSESALVSVCVCVCVCVCECVCVCVCVCNGDTHLFENVSYQLSHTSPLSKTYFMYP